MQTTLKTQFVATFLVASGTARNGHFVALALPDAVLLRRGELSGERQTFWLVGGQTNHDDAVAHRTKRLALVVEIFLLAGNARLALHVIFDHRARRIEVQFAAIVRIPLVAGKCEHKAAERLIRHSLIGRRLHILRAKRLSLKVFALKKQLADFRQMRQGFGIVVVVRRTGPERLFVQLNLFDAGLAIDHRTQLAVSQRERLGPDCGRIFIPHDVAVLRGQRLSINRRRHTRCGTNERNESFHAIKSVAALLFHIIYGRCEPRSVLLKRA